MSGFHASGPSVSCTALNWTQVVYFVGSSLAERQIPVPHSTNITEWVGSGFCVRSRSGVGVSDKFKVTHGVSTVHRLAVFIFFFRVYSCTIFVLNIITLQCQIVKFRRTVSKSGKSRDFEFFKFSTWY